MLLRLADHPFPADADTIFGRSGPLVLEVGFGDGRFLVHLGRTHPDWNLLGAEVSLASVSRAYKRLEREGVASARLYSGSGRFLVRNAIPPKGLHRVYVNFPDPWPRTRHQKNRLLQARFFRLLSTRLADGGALLLTTDHAEYFDFARAEARKSGLFDIAEAPPPPATRTTKYALKWQKEGRDVYHAIFTKTAEADEVFAPIPLFDVMQHALLSGDLAAAQPLTKQIHRYQGGTVILAQSYREHGGPGMLFLALTEEEDFRQELIVKAWPKKEGVYVGLERFGYPVATRGAKEAVRAVVLWLETQGLRRIDTWF